MTNKQTLTKGICILKEKLINFNEALIGGTLFGGVFQSIGVLSSVFKVPYDQLLEPKLCSRMQLCTLKLSQKQQSELTRDCENKLKKNNCDLILYKLDIQIIKLSMLKAFRGGREIYIFHNCFYYIAFYF